VRADPRGVPLVVDVATFAPGATLAARRVWVAGVKRAGADGLRLIDADGDVGRVLSDFRGVTA
jgi:hypothetical protein